MLDVVCFPVSAVLWCWHEILAPAGDLSWAPAVALLVFTLRALLVRLALRQLRAARALQATGPRIAVLRDRHRDDPRRLATELSAFYRREGLRPAGALVPALAQVPVFLCVLHGLGRPGGLVDAHSFSHARLFTAPLAGWVRMPADRLASLGVERWQVAAVAVPLALLAAVATHLTTRSALRRQQTPAGGAVRVVLLYGLPASVLVGGTLFAFPVGILLYWLANNVWTFGQQVVLHRILDREESRSTDRGVTRSGAPPAPGRRPPARARARRARRR